MINNLAFVYPFDSLSSSLREYKTIRMSEFSLYADTLLQPKHAQISQECAPIKLNLEGYKKLNGNQK